jgi:hypothetical protein
VWSEEKKVALTYSSHWPIIATLDFRLQRDVGAGPSSTFRGRMPDDTGV